MSGAPAWMQFASVLSASAEISGEAAKRLDRVTELFGLAGESQAKAS